MRPLMLASLLAGVAVWSTCGLRADPESEAGDNRSATAPDEAVAGPTDTAGEADAPADRGDEGADRPRDEGRPRDREGRAPRDGERPRGRGPEGRFRPRDDEGPRGRPPFRPGPPPFEGRPPFAPVQLPLLRALDADGNLVISAEEIENAAQALKSLDANSDGQLTIDELRPQFAGGGPRGEDFGPAPRGRPPFEGDRRGFGRRGPDDREDRIGPRGPRDDDAREGDRPRRGRPEARGDEDHSPRHEHRGRPDRGRDRDQPRPDDRPEQDASTDTRA